MRVIVCSFLLCAVVSVFAQVPQSLKEYTVSGDYLSEAYKLYVEDKDKALEQFELIHEYDTNYAVAVADMEYIYNEQKNHEKAEELCRKALAENYPKRSTHYLNLVASLFEQEKLEEVEKVIEEALLEFPYNNSLLYDKILLFDKMKRYDDCAQEIKGQLKSRYYFGKTHLKAGILAHEEGQISKSIMALGFYLIMDAGKHDANGVLSFANNIVQAKQKMEPVGFKFSEGDDFSEIDLLINNYVAISKKYKVPFKAQLPLIKQFHLMLSKLEYDAGDKGFFMNYYVPIYKKILKEDKFQGFAYTLLLSSKNESHMSLAAKHSADISAFKKWFYEELADAYQEQEVKLNGKLVTSKVWYDNDQNLEMIGEITDEGTPKGVFNFYYNNGAISTEGEFDEKGKKTGEWNRYYVNSKLKETSLYKDDEINGEAVTYFENGKEDFRASFVDGKIEGKATYHKESGPLTHTLTFVKGKITGPAEYFHTIGTKKSLVSYVESKFEGDYTAFYPDGVIEEKGQFKDDNRFGNFVSYYNNGKVYAEVTYNEKGKYNGSYKQYFSNGQLKSLGEYTDGMQTGKWMYYYYDGALKKEANIDESGKLNGSSILYDIDGVKHSETVYKKGDIQSSIYYTKKGEVIRENKHKGKDLIYKSFSPRGILLSEGKYHSHSKEGEWKHYFSNGQLSALRRYEEGKSEGMQEFYFESGKVNRVYKDIEGETENSEYLSYFSSGKLYEKGFYYKDKRAGEWVEYFRNGELNNKSYYIDGNKVGISTEYTVKGLKDEEYFYEAGVWFKFVQYDSLGEVLNTQELINGTGTLTALTQEGKKYAEFNYVNGVAHGLFTWFYPNGSIQTKGEFFDGDRVGDWIWNYPNGEKEMRGSYLHGKKHGEWLEYTYEGVLIDKTPYVEGQIEGVYFDYDRHGILSSEASYRLGKRHGKTIFYDNEDIDHIRYYEQGDVVAYGYLGKDGKEVPPIKIEGQTADVVSYYATGEVSRKYKLVKGRFDGVYKQFYKNGDVRSQNSYLNNSRNGESIDYYRNGNVSQKLTYEDGMLQGRQYYYYENGKIEYTIDYIVGEMHGWSYYYDNTGKQTFKVRYYNDRVDGL